MNAIESWVLHFGSMKLAVPSCLIENSINQGTQNLGLEHNKSIKKNLSRTPVHYIISLHLWVTSIYLLLKLLEFMGACFEPKPLSE